MSTPSRTDVLSALAAIKDPRRGISVVDSGMATGIVIRDGRVGFALDATGHEDPDALEPLRKECEAAVAALPGVRDVTVVLTAERPAGAAPSTPRPPTTPAPKAGKTASPGGQQTPLPGVGAIVAVASGKGGVGKSTVAVNLALALGRLGLRVGLMDADIYGPSVPRLLGLSGKPETRDRKIQPPVVHGLKAMSIGLMVPEEQAMIWRGAMVVSAISQLMTDVAWAPLDVLVVDMPPGTGDAQLTMAQRVPLAGAVIVSTPQDIALIDARKGIAMFEKTNVPILGVVENMSTFICPHCGEASDIFGHGGAEETAHTLGVPFLGAVPLHLSIRELSDAGTPVVAHAPDSPQAGAFLDIAAQVAAGLEGSAAKGRTPPRLVIED